MPLDRSLHRLTLRVFIITALAFAWTLPVFASCQTEYCRYRRAQQMLDREPVLLSKLAQDPTDSSSIQELIWVLESKARNKRQAARWNERYRFEANSRAHDLNADAQIQQDLEFWRQKARKLGDTPSVCHLGKVKNPEIELAKLREEAAEQPDSATAANCFQFALVSLNRISEAADSADQFLAEHPEDPQAWTNAIAILFDEKPGGRRQLLLERRAELLPTLEHRFELLSYYDRQQLKDLRDNLVAALEAEALPAAEALKICWNLDQAVKQGKTRPACTRRLYDRLASVEDAEPVRGELRSSLLMDAQIQKNWPMLETLLADWPKEDWTDAWATLVNRIPESACPRLIAVADQAREFLPQTPSEKRISQSEYLASQFQECSRDDLALATLNPLLLSPAKDLESAQQALEQTKLQFSLEKNPRLSIYKYRHLTGAESSLSLDERRQLAQRWFEDQPEAVAPIHRLIQLYGESGLYDEAIKRAHQAADAHPSNVEILLALGAAAVRWHRPEVVMEVAAMVERSRFANTRQRAEAAYLKGRVARLQGRFEDAGELLFQYFSLRQRFAPCGPCDGGLIAQLAEIRDLDRLRQYLTVRQRAFDDFLKHHPEEAGSDKSPYDRAVRRRTLPIDDEVTLNYWVPDAAAGRCILRTPLTQAAAGHSTEDPMSICPTRENVVDDLLSMYNVLDLAASLTAIR